jgi:PAS domain S-box-containing protein
MLTEPILISLLQFAPDALVVIDADGQVLFTNRQMRALFGYSSEQLLGSSIDNLLPTRYRSAHGTHRQRFLVGGGKVRPMGSGMTLFGLHHSGHEFAIEISLSPLQDGERTLVAAAIRDISAHLATETRMREAQFTADRANAAKGRFLATASHDLRQPLQSLALLTGTLQRMVSDADIRAVLLQQAQAINTMSGLLNALLDISKLESGAVQAQLSDFALSDLLHELKREFLPIAQERGLALHIDDCADWIHSDPALLGQILRNLLSNAIKFTRSGSVQLQCIVQAGTLRLQVVDTGIGIAAEHMDAICDEFYQVDSDPQTTRQGYGLGLSIVRQVARLLRTRLEINSTPGRGSIFAFQLPRAVAGQGAATITAEPPVVVQPVTAATPGQRILLVEDDASVRDATRLLLSIEGFAVTAVASPVEALEWCDSHSLPDLIISDYHLSGILSGLELIRSLRAQQQRHCPAILMSGDTSAALRGLQEPADVVLLAKPIPPDLLLKHVRQLLSL